jgi:hypothetical protein
VTTSSLLLLLLPMAKYVARMGEKRLYKNFKYKILSLLAIVRYPVVLSAKSVLIVFFYSWGGVRPSPLVTSVTSKPIVPAPDDDDDDDNGADDEYRTFDIMRVGKGNRSTRRKPTPVPLFPQQIPHDLTCDRTQAAAVGNRRLTASAMARAVVTLAFTQIC